MQHYNCKDWALPPNSNDPVSGARAPELEDNVRPLSLPPLNLISSLRVQQDEENCDTDDCPSLPLQHRVTPNRS